MKSTPIDIALFQPATTQLTKLTGQLQADVHVGGTLEAPRLNGLVETTNGGFTVVATGVTYTNASRGSLFEGDRLVVDRFEISDDGQDRLVAIGELGIVRRSVGEMNMQVSADRSSKCSTTNSAVSKSSTRCSRDRRRMRSRSISGELRTEAGRIEVDQLLEQLARSPYRTEATVATATETEGTAAAGTPAPAGAHQSV